MSDAPAPAQFLPAVEAVARRAGDFALAQRARRVEVNERLRHDLKLQMDRDTQTEAERAVRERFPDHAILGEEGSLPAPSTYTWVIDPIDGTMNYFHDLPWWSTSVALRRGEETLAGCVYLPRLGECFTAAADGPAHLNGVAIQVSTITDFREAMILSGLGKPSAGDGYALDRLNRIARLAQKTRVMGSAANDICMVACGRAEAYIDDGIHLWDYAAAALILQCAGGRFEITAELPDGRHQCLSSNGRMHDAVRALL
jgi:myo-inositol-1(or 4)-monophosphatase